jgi:hypothetical protein
MALADYTAYLSMRAAPQERIPFSKTLTLTAANTYSWWRAAGIPAQASIPSAAATVDRTTSGAFGQQNGAGGTLRTFLETLTTDSNATDAGVLIIADRLLASGNLSGTVTTAQTVGGTLSRSTTGAGVIAGYEIYTVIGTTATTITASYTNQAGTAGRTSTAQVFGATGRREAGLFIPMTLQAGDTGVQAVATCTVLATTGTAGAFGVTLLKPLMMIPFVSGQGIAAAVDNVLALGGQLPDVGDDACLQMLTMTAAAGSKVLQGVLACSEV